MMATLRCAVLARTSSGQAVSRRTASRRAVSRWGVKAVPMGRQGRGKALQGGGRALAMRLQGTARRWQGAVNGPSRKPIPACANQPSTHHDAPAIPACLPFTCLSGRRNDNDSGSRGREIAWVRNSGDSKNGMDNSHRAGATCPTASVMRCGQEI